MVLPSYEGSICNIVQFLVPNIVFLIQLNCCLDPVVSSIMIIFIIFCYKSGLNIDHNIVTSFLTSYNNFLVFKYSLAMPPIRTHSGMIHRRNRIASNNITCSVSTIIPKKYLRTIIVRYM